LNKRVEYGLMYFSAALLIMLMVLATWQDLSKLF
ncbi:MAG: hypothetical protein FD133_1186, partial [Erysipelotrichaceae bacterium]